MIDGQNQRDQYLGNILEELENSTNVGLFIILMDGKVLYLNRALTQILGYESPEDLIGSFTNECFVNPADRVQFFDSIRVYSSLKNYELPLKDREGGVHTFLIQASLRGDTITGIATDISQNKEYQHTLEEQRRRYQLATSASGVGIWDWNLLTNTVFYSATWKEQVGYLSGELENEFETWQRLLHPDDYERVHRALYQYLDQPGPFFEIEFRLRHKDGSYRWIHNKAAPLLDKRGKPYRMLGAHTDITERKNSRDQLLKLQRAVMQSPVAIVIISREGQIEFVNPKFTELTGYEPDEVIGENPRILKSGIHKPIFYTRLWKKVLSGQIWEGKFTNRKRDGSLFIEKASISPVFSPEGVITHFVKVAEDITIRTQMEKELRDAMARAEVANIYKNNFLANMSHEIRTPMNGIIGFSELLKEPDVSDEEKSRYIRIINDNCNVLLNLVDDIIDISKIEANEIKLHPSHFSVSELIRELSEYYRSYRKNINRVDVEIVPMIPQYPHSALIETDHLRLRQVLTNLINNALKFCHQGSIEFGYHMAGGRYLYFYVKDTGIGIPPDKIGIIFERFRQTDESITRKYGGTGLGLSISQGLIRMLGGDIWVESKPGSGSVFSFRIPYHPVDKNGNRLVNEIPANPDNPLKSVKVLVAEELGFNYDFLKDILRSRGARVLRWNPNSFKGEKVRDFIPDLVLIDEMLPENQITGIIEHFDLRKIRVPVFGIKPFQSFDSNGSPLSDSFVDHLIRPVDPIKLLRSVSPYIRL